MEKPCPARDRLIMALAVAAAKSCGEMRVVDSYPLSQMPQSAPEIRELLVEHCKVHGC